MTTLTTLNCGIAPTLTDVDAGVRDGQYVSVDVRDRSV